MLPITGNSMHGYNQIIASAQTIVTLTALI